MYCMRILIGRVHPLNSQNHAKKSDWQNCQPTSDKSVTSFHHHVRMLWQPTMTHIMMCEYLFTISVYLYKNAVCRPTSSLHSLNIFGQDISCLEIREFWALDIKHYVSAHCAGLRNIMQEKTPRKSLFRHAEMPILHAGKSFIRPWKAAYYSTESTISQKGLAPHDTQTLGNGISIHVFRAVNFLFWKFQL